MIYDYDVYDDFIVGILKRISVLYTEQLILALMNNYNNVDRERAVMILARLQKDNRVMMSVDGWSVTTGSYLKRTQDKQFRMSKFTGKYRIPGTFSEYISDEDRKRADIFWIVVDMLPDSNNFMSALEPWNYVFVSKRSEKRTSKLFLLTKIEKGLEHLQVPAIAMNTDFSDKFFNENVRTIALFDNGDAIEDVDTSCFSFVCVLNDDSPRHYDIAKRNISRT